MKRSSSPAILRLIGMLVLVVSTTLPLATCTQPVASGEAATVVLGHGFDLHNLSDTDSWFALVAYFWPLIVLPLLFVVRSARIRSALRVAEVLLLICSALDLSAALLFGRPALGFYVGAVGVFMYAAGMVRGVPRVIMRRAASRTD